MALWCSEGNGSPNLLVRRVVPQKWENYICPIYFGFIRKIE